MLDQRLADVLDVDERVATATSRRADWAFRCRALHDADGFDALADDGAGDVLDVLEEPLEPALEVQAVPQHQIGVLRLDDVAGRRLVVVDLGAGLRDGFDYGGVAGDVLGMSWMTVKVVTTRNVFGPDGCGTAASCSGPPL